MWNRPSVPLSLSNTEKLKKREERNSQKSCPHSSRKTAELHASRLALTHARLKNFYILSSFKEEEERERERYVSFARFLFF